MKICQIIATSAMAALVLAGCNKETETPATPDPDAGTKTITVTILVLPVRTQFHFVGIDNAVTVSIALPLQVLHGLLAERIRIVPDIVSIKSTTFEAAAGPVYLQFCGTFVFHIFNTE